MGRVVNFTEVVTDSNIPAERKVQRMQTKMMESMKDLDKRFREAIERYDLNEPEEELFTGYTPAQFYDVVVPIQTLFDRVRLITETHKAILRWMATEYGLSTMSKSTQKLRPCSSKSLRTCGPSTPTTMAGRCLRLFSVSSPDMTLAKSRMMTRMPLPYRPAP